MASRPTKASMACAVASNWCSSLRVDGSVNASVSGLWRPRACAPTFTLSMTDIDANRVEAWNVRPIPSAAMSEGAHLAERSAVQADIAAARAVEPAQAVEQGCLAGAIRPDQAHDPAARNPEGHFVESDDAAKAHAEPATSNSGEAAPTASAAPCGISVMPRDASWRDLPPRPSVFDCLAFRTYPARDRDRPRGTGD